MSTIGVEALVRARMAYKFAVSQEKAFMTGTGVNQPLGLFTASANGIPTSRDVSTGNTATSLTFDGLIEAKYSLKGQYWNNADWIFHRDALKMLTKLKDGEGQYIWRESVRDGEADRLLGRPIVMSEYAPNTFTASLYVGLLGDYSNYWIADALDFQVQVLKELYAETNQTGYIGRLETDGMPTMAESFSRVKLA
jgi:HK97 family phage major capsid protein